MSSWFNRMTSHASRIAGHPLTFVAAAALVVAWAASGPLFGYSETWQLVINTSTTIVTFLMVFLLQSTQNRDTAALQIKLDELIRISKASNALLDLENLDEAKLEKLRDEYVRLAREFRESNGDVTARGPADATAAED
ncbi:low affinity iron permease family protein [Luteimonas aquatica]|uniref:low affinity iron permease family protein n=1 Tax=Luteimonas aquatica TaxID=450364 RepID=UPI001F57A4C3|nr:low affinity iron permease family protein [Luteimonas aquatica]